jgi:NTE family protein
MNRQMLSRRGFTCALGVAASAASLSGFAQTGKIPRLAIVLGAGSARGFAHIGVIKALDAAGIRPQLIVGASAGSVVGVFYAAGYSGAQMEEVALRVRDVDVIDAASNSKRGLIAGDALQKLVNSLVKDKPLEALPTAFIATATNLKTGDCVQLKSGNAGQAVRASSSMPGIFLPTTINDMELVDGAISSPLPVNVARQNGADLIIAVDVVTAPQNMHANGIYEIVMQSFEIMGLSLARLEGQKADVLIKPQVSQYSGSDFNNRAQLIRAGFVAGQQAVEQIRKLLPGAGLKKLR